MTPGSCSTSIHIILEELEEVFEVYIMNLLAGDYFKPDYVAINPQSMIPALVRNDGSTLTEVPPIAYCLAEIMAYVVDTVHGQGFARIFATKTFAGNPNEHQAVRQLGLDIIEKGFAILNDAIADNSYVVGDFSIADPIVFYVAFWADKTKIPMPDSLAAHYRRMLARPVVRRVLQEEGYNLATLGVSERQMRASSGALSGTQHQ